MPYKVVVAFKDLQDGARPYEVGDIFPRKGLDVSEGRLVELSSSANKRGIVLIEEFEEEPAKEVREKKKRNR